MTASRDRDVHGRPRNARPRDATGRPLPRGAAGQPRVPDDLALPPGATLAEAQALLDRSLPFTAHEVLEAAWKAAPPPERTMWRALAQLAVALTHAQRGNARGASALFRRAAAGLEEAAPAPYGVRADLAATARELAALADGGRLDEVAERRVRLVG